MLPINTDGMREHNPPSHLVSDLIFVLLLEWEKTAGVRDTALVLCPICALDSEELKGVNYTGNI